MKLSCNQLCRIKEFLANLKCPNCFSAKVKLCEEETEENATCEKCGCEFKFNPEISKISKGSWQQNKKLSSANITDTIIG